MLWPAAQVLIGFAAGIVLAKTMTLPEEQIALIATVITLVTWLTDEAVKLRAKDTRVGTVVHGILRFLPLVGFIMALHSLAALNGLAPLSPCRPAANRAVPWPPAQEKARADPSSQGGIRPSFSALGA